MTLSMQHWPVVAGIVIALVGYGGSLAIAQDTKAEVEKLKQTSVSEKVLDLKLLPLQQALERIEESLRKA